MRTITDVQAWRGQQLVNADGDKIGKIDEVYVDRETGEPKFLAVKTGLFGSSVSFVPVEQAEGAGDDVSVPYTKDQVKDAPHVEEDSELSPEEERRIFEHYQLSYTEYAGPDHGAPTGRDARGDRDQAGGADDAMTRSEEELHVGTTSRESGRARLRKYVVTEQVETTVPVQREEVRVEREPITAANAGDALDGPAISEDEHEVVLHAEEPVVETRAVAKERVRLSKDTVTDEETVTGEVRKERIDTEGVDERR